MNTKHLNSEKGQAIVYLVIGLVVFLGFVALAIDGGMALADRRHLQNSADAGSLAGGGEAAQSLEQDDITKKNWDCNSQPIINARAAAVAAANARTSGNISHEDAGITISTDCQNKYIDVTVDVTATTPSNFLQLIFPNALQNYVDAVTRVNPRQPISPENAIIALNSEECEGNKNGDVFYINPQDDTTLQVYNGSIHSNGCIKCNGSPNIIVSCDYIADPECNPAALGSFGNDPETCNGTWIPAPESPVEQIDPEDFSDFTPDCSDPAAHFYDAKDFNKDIDKADVDLEPGLWCIDGNISINASDKYKITGTDVTLYMLNGDFKVNGVKQINLSASTNPHASPEIPGVLIYVPAPDPFDASECTNHNVKLNGTEFSTFIGSIVAPCSLVTLSGTGGNTYQGQVVGWNVEVGGDATLKLTYDENLVATKPTSIELYK
jgi:Flp pilus assembly protein TadG